MTGSKSDWRQSLLPEYSLIVHPCMSADDKHRGVALGLAGLTQMSTSLYMVHVCILVKVPCPVYGWAVS